MSTKEGPQRHPPLEPPLDEGTQLNMDGGVDAASPWGLDHRCHLTMRVPQGTVHVMKKLLTPLLQWVDPSFQMVQIAECQEHSKSQGEGQPVPKYQGDGSGLSVPALSVMLFLQERGDMSAAMMVKSFKRSPWKLHHKIELQSRRTPEFKVAEQAFYSLSREFPLWAVCPVHAGHEHLRINLFVRNYRAMVEFYRLVADSEMESSKAGFCIFPLHSCKQLSVQLALKHSPGLRPYPTPEAFLTFKVRDVHSLLAFLKTDVQEISPRRYLVQDPDGNDVVLHDVTPCLADMVTSVSGVTHRGDGVTSDVTSVRSNCESHDSGRFSDSDLCGSEVDHGQWCTGKGQCGGPGKLRTCGRLTQLQTLWDCHRQLSDAITNLAASDDTCATSSGMSSLSAEDVPGCSTSCHQHTDSRADSKSQPSPHQYLHNKRYYTRPVYL